MKNKEINIAQNADLSVNFNIIKGAYNAFATSDFPAFLGAMDPKI